MSESESLVLELLGLMLSLSDVNLARGSEARALRMLLHISSSSSVGAMRLGEDLPYIKESSQYKVFSIAGKDFTASASSSALTILRYFHRGKSKQDSHYIS